MDNNNVDPKEKLKEELARRPLYVYGLPKVILETLAPKDHEEDDLIKQAETETETTSSNRTALGESGTENAGGSKSCSLCGVAFPTVEDQRGHIRSDLHNYNLKQKIRGWKPVTEEDFEKLVGDLDESLSGSDSSDSEDDENGKAQKDTILSALLRKQAAISSVFDTDENEDLVPEHLRQKKSGRAPMFWFTSPNLPSNTYLGIYRSIFSVEEQANESAILDVIRKKQLTPKPLAKIPTDPTTGVPLPYAYKDPHIFLCMMGGGHFAAMVVSLAPKQTKSTPTGPLTKEATVLAHKTFHRYTTRRKQGGAQSSNDAAKGAAHSAGASLRRYNEQALMDEVRLLLQEWKGMIDSSELLFIRATGNTNRRTLYGPYDGQVLRLNDPRIRGFPFNTRRATQNELIRAFVELTRVKVLEVDEAAVAAAKQQAQDNVKRFLDEKAAKNAKSSSKGPMKSEEEETLLFHSAQIQGLTQRAKVPALLKYLKDNDLSPDFKFQPPDDKLFHHAPVALHIAASRNSPPVVYGLLLKAGSDPTILNGDGKPAFDLVGDRATRDAFRVARSELGEKQWDWDAAHVPPPITRAEAEKRDAREKAAEAKQEEGRRKVEEKRLQEEGPKVVESGPLGKAAGRGRALALGKVQKTAQEKRQEEARGMTPEMQMRLERERRARAAEERMKRMAGGSGGNGR